MGWIGNISSSCIGEVESRVGGQRAAAAAACLFRPPHPTVTPVSYPALKRPRTGFHSNAGVDTGTHARPLTSPSTVCTEARQLR